MIAVLAASTFIVVFTIVAGRALLSQRSYQARVIDKKEKARDQLKKNIEETKTLVTSYKSFTDRSENVLGANPAGQGEKDGDNAKIILDALPSKYNFPAIAPWMDKLIAYGCLKGNFSPYWIYNFFILVARAGKSYLLSKASNIILALS